jgi:hypothetical protein
MGPNGKMPVEAARERERHRPYILPFERIGTLTNGLFICGNYPALVIMERGEVRLHPVSIDGPITSFCSFNNLSCPMGFLYLAANEKMMRISLLPVSKLTNFVCILSTRCTKVGQKVKNRKNWLKVA